MSEDDPRQTAAAYFQKAYELQMQGDYQQVWRDLPKNFPGTAPARPPRRARAAGGGSAAPGKRRRG